MLAEDWLIGRYEAWPAYVFRSLSYFPFGNEIFRQLIELVELWSGIDERSKSAETISNEQINQTSR